MTMAVAVTVTIWLVVRPRVDSNKAARRCLWGLRLWLWLRLRLWCMAGASTIHERYIRGTQRADRRGGTRRRSAIEDSLLAPFQSMIELPCACSNCVASVYVPSGQTMRDSP